ncbi:MAG: hypothetical protein LBC82_02015 [Oscillospiraceae bacterium]|jgi:uncharacterized membrane protein YvbJ|nr:hypothetical protein [Oscillospiraceae bacterium]
MYCYKCGLQIEDKALECEHCHAYTAHVMRPKFLKFSILMGACLLIMPFLSFITELTAPLVPYLLIIFGIIGLPLAFISKRKLAIGINITAIILWVMLIITPFFAENYESQNRDSGNFSESVYAEYAEKNRERYRSAVN